MAAGPPARWWSKMKALRLWICVLALLASWGAGGGQALAAQETATPFQAGDRILLRVEGDSTLSDTFTVVAAQGGPALRLPVIGEISLAGVPRSALEAHLTRELGRFIKDPVIQARALIRVSVIGQVVRPGFYAVPIDLVLADALMLAGGATQDARVDQLRILRGATALWSGSTLQAAIARGSTLDDLGMRAGDRVEVPKGADPESKWRIAGLIVTSLAAAVGIIAIAK
jgi:protein involved in polysaccharide export with SLBB domain